MLRYIKKIFGYATPPPAIVQMQIPDFLTKQDWDIINSLNPKVRKMCIQLVNECRRQGITLQIVSGYRSSEEQKELYQRGRDEDGNIIDQSQVVTMTRAGYSKHNWGLAFDFCINMKGYDKYDERLIQSVGAIGEKLIGLTWGGHFKSFVDSSHFEWTNGLTIYDLINGKKP
jgi:peptidoglycan L-alanyl-D-glutamate endopeptidase CwlK